jgi:succinoglycan biosynthesis transport protein ExoP
MNMQQLFMVLKARYKIALLTMLVITLATLAISLLLPKRYTASTSVVVNMLTQDPIVGDINGPVSPNYLPTQVDIIYSERTAQKVVRALHLADSQVVHDRWLEDSKGEGKFDNWLVGLVQKGLSVKPSQDSNVITISYVSADPDFSSAAANAFAQAYIDTNIELKVEPAKDYAKWFQGQGKTLRDNLEAAQNRLSNYQQKKGIVITDERLDSETAKLAELNTQLTIVEATSADTRSKLNSQANTQNMPEFTQSPLINNLRASITDLESKLQQASGNLGKNHPQYKSMEAQLSSLKQQLQEETQHVARSFVTTEDVGRDKATNLRALIAAQKQKLLELRHQRDEANVLLSDVASAQKAYDAVSARFTQSNLEGKSTQTNVSVLTFANSPLKPSSPLPVLYTLIAAVVGLLLGIGMSFMAEMMDRRVRVPADIEQTLGIPVLAELSRQQSAISRWWKKVRLLRRPRTLEFAT